MSRFENGGLRSGGRNAASLPAVALPGIPLTVPGLDVPPPVVQRSSLASSLLTGFGLVDQISGTIASGVERERALERQRLADIERDAARDEAAMERNVLMAERAAAKEEAAIEKNKKIARGAGVNAVQRLVPELQSRLAKSTLLLNPQESRDYNEALIRSSLVGMDEESINAAVEYAAPQLDEVAIKRYDQLREQATNANTENLLATAASASGDGVGELAKQMVDNDSRFTDESARRVVTMKRIDAAVARGKPDDIKKAIDEAGVALDQNAVIKATFQAEAAAREQQNLADDEAEQQYTALANLIGWSAVIPVAKEDPALNAKTVQTLQSRADAEARATQAEVDRLARQQAEAEQVALVEAAKKELNARYRDALGYPGGLSRLGKEDRTIVIKGAGEGGSDLTVSVNEEDAKLAAARDEFAEIDRTVTDPVNNFIAKADLVRNQNGALVIPEWKSSLSRPMTIARPGLTPDEVPPDAVQSYSLYLALEQRGGPAVTRSHTDASTLEFYRLVREDQTDSRTPGGGGRSVAESIAVVANIDPARTIDVRPPEPDTGTKALITSAAQELYNTIGIDPLDAEQLVKSKLNYRWRMRGGVAYAETSINSISSDLRADYAGLDGTPVYIRDIPNWEPSMPALAQQVRVVLANELKVNPESVRFTMRESGELALRDLAGLPIRGTPIVTTDDLAAIASALDRLETFKRTAEGIRNTSAAASRRGEGAGPTIATPAGPVVPRSFFRPLGVASRDEKSAQDIVARAESGEGLSPDAARVFKAIIKQGKVVTPDGPSIATPVGPVMPTR